MKRRFSYVSIIIGLLFCFASSNLVAFAQEANSPEDKRSGERRGPPREAIDACSNKSESDSCSFETPRGQLTGECRTIKEEKVCVPEGAPQGPPEDEEGHSKDDRPSGKGAPPKEAIDACSGMKVEDSCQVETPRGTLSGSCRSIEDQLACAPKDDRQSRQDKSSGRSLGRQ